MIWTSIWTRNSVSWSKNASILIRKKLTSNRPRVTNNMILTPLKSTAALFNSSTGTAPPKPLTVSIASLSSFPVLEISPYLLILFYLNQYRIKNTSFTWSLSLLLGVLVAPSVWSWSCFGTRGRKTITHFRNEINKERISNGTLFGSESSCLVQILGTEVARLREGAAGLQNLDFRDTYVLSMGSGCSGRASQNARGQPWSIRKGKGTGPLYIACK